KQHSKLREKLPLCRRLIKNKNAAPLRHGIYNLWKINLFFVIDFLNILFQSHGHRWRLRSWSLNINTKPHVLSGFNSGIAENRYASVILFKIRKIFKQRLYSAWTKKY